MRKPPVGGWKGGGMDERVAGGRVAYTLAHAGERLTLGLNLERARSEAEAMLATNARFYDLIPEGVNRVPTEVQVRTRRESEARA